MQGFLSAFCGGSILLGIPPLIIHPLVFFNISGRNPESGSPSRVGNKTPPPRFGDQKRSNKWTPWITGKAPKPFEFLVFLNIPVPKKGSILDPKSDPKSIPKFLKNHGLAGLELNPPPWYFQYSGAGAGPVHLEGGVILNSCDWK